MRTHFFSTRVPSLSVTNELDLFQHDATDCAAIDIPFIAYTHGPQSRHRKRIISKTVFGHKWDLLWSYIALEYITEIKALRFYTLVCSVRGFRLQACKM